jgi:hypothetical protein
VNLPSLLRTLAATSRPTPLIVADRLFVSGGACFRLTSIVVSPLYKELLARKGHRAASLEDASIARRQDSRADL